MSADPHLEYLTVKQVAEKLGIQARSVYQSMWRGLMPEPDLVLLNHPLWLPDTIDRWRQKKWKHRKKSRRVTRKARLARPASTNRLPPRAKLSRDGAAGAAPLPQATVMADVARAVAAKLRDEGHHCTGRDVQELAQADPADLDYDRRKLQQRVNRKLRELV